MLDLTGRCLCGAVTWKTTGTMLWAAMCHCQDCCRAASSDYVSWFGVLRDTVVWQGPRKLFNSSKLVSRSFCQECGTPTSFETEVFPNETHLYAVTLDDVSVYRPTAHIFWSERLPWIQLAIAEKLEAPWVFMHPASIRHKLAASFSPTLRNRIQGLRERIHVAGPTSPQILSSFGAPQPECMAVIFQTFLEMRSLRMRYEDADGNCSERYIEPHHLLLCPPVWYLYAWDNEKNAVRCFRCDRIQSAALEDLSFPERPYQLFESAIMSMGGATI